MLNVGTLNQGFKSDNIRPELLSGALTVAIPDIGIDLHISEANLQWPLTIFSLAYGRMADIFGPRILFLLGGAWFSVWYIGTAFAPNLTTVTIFIAMLGLGAAANSPAGIGIIASHFRPYGKELNWDGVLLSVSGLGFLTYSLAASAADGLHHIS
ncbi:hypothetical protein DFH08DRAFT_964883 [Mycena albidolilacea]|uniref:Major facilitator superfamily (MFS) profile domain-containing protein n=1 Tax=Mycena albidolilacea TaxID=1033008 RepID=A0AAD6ZSM9_9AGAR|nr:hypothetical protein DFH08DRAFT_964883 [Mycena albidolilacea]